LVALPHWLVQLPPAHVGDVPLQAWHVLPFTPHAALSAPDTQLVPLQQPPLHVRPPAQEVLQMWLEEHASPEGQSFALLQPHWPCTQA
jgi:hypothetical protein